MENEYTTIDTQEAMDHFIWLVDGFHDALLRELGMACRGYVDEEGTMYADWAQDVHLVIHSQFVDETPCIDIMAEDVQKLAWKQGYDLDGTKGVVADGMITLLYPPQPEVLTISARSMKYRVLGRESLGKRFRVVRKLVESEDLT